LQGFCRPSAVQCVRVCVRAPVHEETFRAGSLQQLAMCFSSFQLASACSRGFCVPLRGRAR
jgi:hypothetical protein